MVVLHAQRRSREVAFLRTLGLTERQVAGLTVVEQGLPVILALAVGIALGLGLAWLLEPGIDLAAFSGPGAPVAPAGRLALRRGRRRRRSSPSWPLAVALSSWLARRLDLGHALRIGEE